MDNKVDELLNQLREAIHEALADSFEVISAVAELEEHGCCPTFSVNVTVAEPSMYPQNDACALSEYDKDFLRAIKVAASI